MSATFEAPSDFVDFIRFGFYSSDEVRELSVKKITRPELFDAKGVPVQNGLYDLSMGAVKDSDSCKTCGLGSYQCPGHCGHIELVETLYNPLLFRSLKSFLQITCFHCKKFRMNEPKVRRYISILKYIIDGDIIAARSIETTALSEVVLSGRAEGEDSDVEEERVDIPSKDTNADTKVGLPSEELPSGSKDADKKTWTSLQYAEGIAILNKFMKESKKKCANCKRANPALSSPTFGWLNMTLRGSSISANTILESDLGMLSANEDRPADPASDDDSQDDEELSSPANAPFQSRNFTPDNFKGKLSSAGQDHLLPSEAESILKDLWKNEPELCRLICNMQQNNLSVSGSDTAHAMFFLKDIIVPPCKFRPPALGGHGAIEHPQNILLAKVQESNIALGKLLVARPDDDITRWRMDLQRSVNVLYDSSKGIAKSERDNNGIRQLLEKKAGILRQKMMGKRVNFACRSVISPDPCLAVNEIGIPPDFALKLTYPERVTPWNVNNMRHAIMNGATIHPGASHYVEKDTTYKLHVPRHKRSQYSRRLPTSRVVTGQSGKGPLYDFEGKIVYRHLQDGDIVLVNRQPTLHKPSMMAHVVRVLKGEKTLRMHYANCSTYNADFDGDEMNVHFPQDEISRAEAINIVNANKQYIVPTSGEPIRGLIQDHIVSAVLLSMKGLFLTREEYHQLLYASCVPPTLSSQSGNLGRKVCTVVSDNEIKPLPPAIWKPKPLWTGKQVIAAILCHITRGRSPFTVEKEGRIPKEYFATDSKESMMHINNNDFIHGMIDKAQFGKYGLVHIVHELYGADIAGTLLSIFSRLFTTFLHMNGFTCGVDDLLLLRESDIDRENMLKTCEERSVQVHLSYTHMEKDAELSDLHREIEKIIRSHGEAATVRLDRMMSNALNMLTSDVNKKLFPSGLQKPFPKNCLSLMTTTGAKGGLVNLTQISSLLGQQELEGKRVPRIISGKTLPCFSPWDISCRAGGFISDRFLTGLRPQEYYFHCMAGRDGLVDTAIKTSRSGYLQRCLVKSLESLKVCYDYTVRDADGSIVQFAYGEDGVDVLKSSYITELEVLANNKRVVLESLSSQLEDSRLSKLNGYIKELPYNLKEKAKEFAKQVTSGKGHNRIKKKDVMKLMMLKYMSSLADPGESVGVIAAQSVGEPSTQMTLNTFHLAGRGDMNVTLGIPRLQEILMTAKEEIRTPIMTCPLLTERDPRKLAPALAAKLRRICIADIVESIDVSTLPFFIHKDCVSTLYKLKMKLYPPHLYPESTKLEFKDVIEVLQTSFVEAMEVAITRHLDFISKISDIEVSSGMAETNVDGEIEDVETENKSVNGEDNGGGGGGGGGENDDDDGDSDNGEDQGADGEKRKKQRCDEMEYEDDIEKHSSTAVVNELNEGVQSGFESEVDQAEVEDDYELGQDDPSSLTDKKMPDSKHTTKPPHGPEVSEKKKETKKVGHRKKIKSVIHVEAKGFTFEVHFKLTNQPHILLAEIAQKTAKSIFVQQSKNIDRCSVVELKRSGDVALQTLGVNFFAFWDMQDHLDIDKVVTNDIVAMLNTYGVEAARATIINEVKAVFDPYGIKVNTRHLSLIADFMTAHGGYRPMNRLGMMDFNTSPFSKMTFETATRFIIEAAFHGESDMLESPSASICLGQPVKFGTGVFDLLQKL